MPGLLTAKELREKRMGLITQAREVLDAAHAEGRETMNAEETTKWTGFMDEADGLKTRLDVIERQEAAEHELAESRGRRAEESRERESRNRPPRDGGTEDRRQRTGQVTDVQRGDALRGWLMRGTNNMPPQSLRDAAQSCGIDLDNRLIQFNLTSRALRSLDREDIREWEQRALSLVTTEGGFTVPDEMMRALEVALLRFGGMRQVSDIIRTSSGAALPWPTTNDTTNEGEILGINTQVNQQDVVFGQLVLDAYKYSSKMILVPVELLQDSSVNIPDHLGTALGQRIGRITNKHFTTGDGSSKPRGVATAAAVGKTGATGQTTSVIYDDLVDLLHSVDPDYREGARWMFADSTLKALKKIKIPQFSGDTLGLPLWQPGMTLGQPDTILGYPYTINQQVAAMAANARSILFGDFSKYKIRDVQDVILRRLDERFADFHQVAFLAFSRHDGDLLDAGTNPVKCYVNSAT